MRGTTPAGIHSQLFALGGGSIVTRETFEFDKLVVEATGRSRPWALCIPTASQDNRSVMDDYGRIFGDQLRCRTDYLRLFSGEPNGDDFKRKVGRSELFYIPDGDFELLMATLDKYGVSDCLREAHQRGAIFYGIGAGAAALGAIGFAGNGPARKGLELENVGVGTLKEEQTMSDKEAVSKFAGNDGPSFLVPHLAVLNVDGVEFRTLSSSSSVISKISGGKAEALEAGRKIIKA